MKLLIKRTSRKRYAYLVYRVYNATRDHDATRLEMNPKMRQRLAKRAFELNCLIKIKPSENWKANHRRNIEAAKSDGRGSSIPWIVMDVRLSIISADMDITTDTVANFSLVLLLPVARIRRCAFLGGGFNYTSHAHARPFGPAAHLGQRRVCERRAYPKKSRIPARY